MLPAPAAPTNQATRRRAPNERPISYHRRDKPITKPQYPRPGVAEDSARSMIRRIKDHIRDTR